MKEKLIKMTKACNTPPPPPPQKNNIYNFKPNINKYFNDI